MSYLNQVQANAVWGSFRHLAVKEEKQLWQIIPLPIFLFIYFYLLEKFVWHHTSLNFVHTKKNPFQGALAFFDNASSVLLSRLGTDTDYTRMRGRCVCAHFSGDSGPQPRHLGWWWTPPCRCSRGGRRRGRTSSDLALWGSQGRMGLSSLSCEFFQRGSSNHFRI